MSNCIWNIDIHMLTYQCSKLSASLSLLVKGYQVSRNVEFQSFYLCPKILVNSLYTGRCGCDFKCVNFYHNFVVRILNIEVIITLEWIPKDLVAGNSPFMMTSSKGNIFRVTGHLWGEFTGEFPAQRPVTPSFDVFFDLCLNKRLSKQSWGW